MMQFVFIIMGSFNEHNDENCVTQRNFLVQNSPHVQTQINETGGDVTYP